MSGTAITGLSTMRKTIISAIIVMMKTARTAVIRIIMTKAGIDGKFTGNYVAKFENGQRSVDIHVEDSGVYINGNEVRDVNTYKDTMTFRVGYATYTLKANGRGSWNDSDAGNAGKIVRE